MQQRQKYIDIDLLDLDGSKDVVQLKYDGIWCMAVVENNHIKYYSRNGKLKKEESGGTSYIPNGKYIGELMFGSEWAQAPDRKGKLYLFDCIEYEGYDLKEEPYVKRFKHAFTAYQGHPMWEIVNNYTSGSSVDLWKAYVKLNSWEGLIFRSSQGTWDETIQRCKAEFELDLEIVDFEEGKGALAGSLGTILASRIAENPSQRLPLVEIGGGLSHALRKQIWLNKGMFRNRIISISCKKIFKSGKLRHANFLRFHPDKNTEEFISKWGDAK